MIRSALYFHGPSSTLLLPSMEQNQLVEADRLVRGSAAAGPTAQDRLQYQHCLRECQAGRWTFGESRSKVRKACAGDQGAMVILDEGEELLIDECGLRAAFLGVMSFERGVRGLLPDVIALARDGKMCAGSA